MKIVVLIVVIVLAVVLFRTLRSSSPSRSAGRPGSSGKRAGPTPAASSAAQGSKYHAVSVKCGAGACEQALALENRRFLSGQMGQLPLEGCTAADCRCKFVHYPDRRDAEGDKRAPTALRSELYAASGKPERRTRAGRRKSDFK